MCNAISRFSGWFNAGCSVVFRLTFSIKMTLFLDKHKISGVFWALSTWNLAFTIRWLSVSQVVRSSAARLCNVFLRINSEVF